MAETTTATANDVEILFTRTVEAPRDLVWKMWTEAEHLKQWWSPRGFTTPICTVDLRVGGVWHYAMQDADGQKHWGIARYEEIVPIELLRYRDAFSNEAGDRVPPETSVTVTLIEHGGRTEMRSLVVCDSKEQRDQLVEMGMVVGMNQTVDKLEEYLASGRDESDIFISREFDAPVEAVFRAWTEPEQIQAWWGPEGFHCETQSIDIRKGGEWRFVMIGPDGKAYPNLISYQQIVPNERIEYSVGDGITAEPEFTAVTTFEDLGGRTRVTMRSTLPSAAERERVVGFGAIELGYSTLDKLAKQLGLPG